MSEAAKEASISPVDGEQEAASVKRDETSMMTNSHKEIREIYQVRTQLLVLAAELIVRTASDEAIALLRGRLPFIREMAASNNLDGAFWAIVAFRNLEAEICGNR